MKVAGKIIAVTGGGSGIGRALTLELLQRGARVAAIDLRSEGLKETASQASAGDRLSLHAADVSDREAVAALPEAIRSALGEIDGVINCAGIIQPFVDFADLDDATISRVINVNLWGTINVTRAFIPGLLNRPEAHIANVSSMGGFIPFPGQSLYSASKAAVKLLTEGLYAETLGTNVGVSVVMPGAVATNITENSGVEIRATAGEGSMKALPAEEAARIIIDGIEKRKLHILVGRDAKSLWLMSRLAPARAIRMIQKAMSKLGT